jgi:hypothetical protein
MPTIDVDFDVFKALTNRRPSEEVTENEVLRELLHLPRRNTPNGVPARTAPDDWVTKGVRLVAGTEMRGIYKGQSHLGRVADGGLVLNGKRFNSPSAAAMSVTGHPVNGWTFWEYRPPGEGKWTRLAQLRKKE